MVKDGTNRGGPRPGTCPKRKALKDRITDGTAKKALIIPTDLPEPADLTGEDVPPVKDYLKQKQKNGSTLCAEEIFRETWMWLKSKGCETLVNNQLLEQYAMSVARWIQCEEAISEFGYLAKHPTTGAAIASPYVFMSLNAKRVNAKEKEVENEKYAFRCFLLRLGFIGEQYKMDRKVLLQNLTGSSAFKSGKRKFNGEDGENA